MRRLALLLAPAVALGVAAALPTAATAAPAAPQRTVSPSARHASPTHAPEPATLGHPAARVPRAAHWAPTAVSPAGTLDPAATRLASARDGSVVVTVDGDATQVAARVSTLGGRVLTHVTGVSSVRIAKARLTRLAAASGVTGVRAPVRAVAEAVTSEGVAASGADAWQAADPSDTGAGATVAVVDLGFSGLAAAQAAGDLPAGISVVNDGCDAGSDGTEHGTAVAEIVHQMAPSATLRLYCITDTVGFGAAAADIVSRGIRIASSSLGFPLDSRGDGTGAQSGAGITAAGVVQKARKAGVLWIQSAGNDAANHWGGKLADADRDGEADLDGVYDENAGHYEADVSYVAPGSASSPSVSTIDLQWDQWPTSTSAVTLVAYGYQCTTEFQPDGTCGEQSVVVDGSGHTVPADYDGEPTKVAHPSGTAPIAEIAATNTSAYLQYWVVFVEVPTGGLPTVRYDLTYGGAVDGASDLACGTVVNYQCTLDQPSAYRGSIASPASSPYALAVGAADVGVDGHVPGTLEPFSSQGPTVDGRVKPDITAWDGVTSPVYGSAASGGGFYGTSAAAPHVAGAAALIEAANPSLDPAQVQNLLEQRASHLASGTVVPGPYNPAGLAFGHGLLTLGATPATTPITAPAGSRYAAITPKRILDTRTTTGGHKAPLTSGAVVTLTVPGLPADATAVAVNLTGTGAAASSVLTAYPGGTSSPSSSNLNLSKTDPTAAVFAVVRVSGAHTISVRNSGATVNVIVDELGWFGTGAETGLYTALAPSKRVLDTRSTVGGHKGKLAAGRSVTVNPALPVGATAAVVNIAAANATASGYLRAAPTCAGSSSALNFNRYARANLAIVTLSARTFCITGNGGSEDVIVDVVGYLGATGAEYHPLPASSRIVDTRTGNGGAGNGHATSPFGAARTVPFYGAGLGDVPASATGLLTGVAVTAATTAGYLSLFPGTTRPAAAASTINFTPGRIVANASVTGLSTAHQFGVFNSAGTTSGVVDLYGWFAPPPAA